MSLTISQVRSWQPAALTTVSGTLTGHATALAESLGAATAAMRLPLWWGATHDAAELRIAQEADHAAEVRTLLLATADLSADAAAALAAAARSLLSAVDAAVAAGFQVTDDGAVGHPDPTRAEAVAVVAATIRAGLDTAADLDRHYGALLAACETDLAGIRYGQPSVTLADGSRVDPDRVVEQLTTMTPEQRRALLAGLSPEQIRRLVTADPLTMGNLDGVDFAVRIEANDINIRTALIAVEMVGHGDGPRATQLREMLTPAADPHAPEGTEPMVRRQFLAFENTETGRYIEQVGDLLPGVPGAAVMIPGTGSNLNGSDGHRRSAAELARRSGAPVFLYVDGELPQELAPDLRRLVNPLDKLYGIPQALTDLPDTALSPTLAGPMAADLVTFGRELDREIAAAAPGTPTTYIGHSYGGSVLGTAEQLGLNADRTVYASAAGTGIYDGPWRNPNPEVERFSLTAPGDPIHYAQQFGAMVHGGDPDVAEGVTRLDTGHYSGDRPEHQGLVAGMDGHSRYWQDPDSTAFENLVAVIRGDTPSEYVFRSYDMPDLEHARLYARIPWETVKLLVENHPAY